MCERASVRACVRACVCMRERERERESLCGCVYVCVCMHACVCDEMHISIALCKCSRSYEMGHHKYLLSQDETHAQRALTQSGIMAGKLKGVMPATTPSGRRYVMVSMSLAMPCSVSPSCSDVMLQQCSTTSAASSKRRKPQDNSALFR